MIDGRNSFDQPVKNIKKKYENVRKIATGLGDDYITACLLDYCYFKENYMVAMDLSKQQALIADRKTSQQITFIANSDRAGNTRIYVIFEKAKETLLD